MEMFNPVILKNLAIVIAREFNTYLIQIYKNMNKLCLPWVKNGSLYITYRERNNYKILNINYK